VRYGVESVVCAHCETLIGRVGENFYDALPRQEGPPSTAGPQIWNDPAVYIDREVTFRQYYCPGCYVALHTEVVPADHDTLFDKELIRGVALRE
jgi:N-methylhydantoinase B